jgi:hypothetical protein
MGFYGGLMGSNGISDWIYPLVNVYITNWKITMLLMGKSIISMAIFNCYVSSPEGIDGYSNLM